MIPAKIRIESWSPESAWREALEQARDIIRGLPSEQTDGGRRFELRLDYVAMDVPAIRWSADGQDPPVYNFTLAKAVE